MIFNFWKEAAILALSVLILLFLRARKKETDTPFIRFDLTDKLLIGFFALGIAHFLLAKIGVLPASSQFSLFLWGAKYDYIFLWSLFVAKHFEFRSEQLKSFFKTAIVAGSISLLLGFILHFIVKSENLTVLGFRDDWSTWFPNQSLAFCQRIENMELCRMAGTFAGPNQLGAYVVVLLPLFLLWYRQRKNWFSDRIFSSRITVTTLIILALAALFLTFSRSAYVGIIVAMLLLISNHYHLRPMLKKYWPLLLIPLVLGAAIIFIKKDIFLRPGSSSGHLQAFTLGLEQMLTHPLGLGLGTAGPASFHSATPLIPENWYLQIGIELGFVGLILFCALMASIAQKLYIQGNQKSAHNYSGTLFASFIALAVMAFFLHIYEDAPTNVSFFLLVGTVLGSKQKRN